jgi:hypothetical protein
MVWVVVRQASLFSKDGLNFGRHIYIVHFVRFLEDRGWGIGIDLLRAGGPDGLGDDLKGSENASPEGHFSGETRLKPGQMELTFRFA